jgi:predicted nucleic acid-binding protein
MARVIFLVDRSVLARVTHRAVAVVFEPLLRSGCLATCGIVTLEMLYSARSREELRSVRAEQVLAFVQIPIEQQDFDRAADVLEQLSATGQHRAAPIPDLLIAVCAERADLTVLHYDADFDAIAARGHSAGSRGGTARLTVTARQHCVLAGRARASFKPVNSRSLLGALSRQTRQPGNADTCRGVVWSPLDNSGVG